MWKGLPYPNYMSFSRISGCSESLMYRLEGEIILVLAEIIFPLNNNEGNILPFPGGMRFLSKFSTSL
jgi:hypothetical protein